MTPAVSIGVPVYNGAESIADALESLVNQSFRDVEIIVSDNSSTDETAAICLAYATCDPRIRYVRQERFLSADDNFAYVRNAATGRYFMWAAHDDTRDIDFVQRLVSALNSNPQAVLAMGDVVEIRDGTPRQIDFDFETIGLSRVARLRKAAFSPMHHVYGVWRLDALRRVAIREGDWWSDTPIMMAGTCLGDYIHVPGTIFRYKYNAHWFIPQADGSGGHRPLRWAARLLRRAGDLPRLVWLSAAAVTEVAGPIWGAVAGIFAAEKVVRQIVGFSTRRLARKW